MLKEIDDIHEKLNSTLAEMEELDKRVVKAKEVLADDFTFQIFLERANNEIKTHQTCKRN